MTPSAPPLAWRWWWGTSTYDHFVLTDAQGRIMQPPTGSAPITLSATRHKSTGSTSFQVESDFSQARMLASWGSSDYTVAASGDKYLITAGGKVYTFTPGSVGLGVPLPTVVAEFEVASFNASPRPFSIMPFSVALYNFVEVGADDSRSYGDLSSAWTQLSINTPTPSLPSDPYFFCLWVDASSEDLSEPIVAGTSTEIESGILEQEDVPVYAVWSFGDLLTYPSVPVIG